MVQETPHSEVEQTFRSLKSWWLRLAGLGTTALQLVTYFTLYIVGLLRFSYPVATVILLAVVFTLYYFVETTFRENKHSHKQRDCIKVPVKRFGEEAWTGNEMISKFVFEIWPSLDALAMKFFKTYLQQKLNERLDIQGFTIDCITLGSTEPHIEVQVSDDVTKLFVSATYKSMPPFTIINFFGQPCVSVTDFFVKFRIRAILNENFGGELSFLEQPEISWKCEFTEKFRHTSKHRQIRRLFRSANERVKLEVQNSIAAFTFPKWFSSPELIGRNSLPVGDRPTPKSGNYEVTLVSVRGLGPMPSNCSQAAKDKTLNIRPDKFETFRSASFIVSVARHSWTSKVINLTNGNDAVGLKCAFTLDEVADFIMKVEAQSDNTTIAEFSENLDVFKLYKENEFTITYYLPMKMVYPNESSRYQPRVVIKYTSVQ